MTFPPPPSTPTSDQPIAVPPSTYAPPPGYSSPYVTAPIGSPTPVAATSTSATIAFVLSLLGLVLTPVVDIAAVIVGHYALATIRRTGQAGAGLAKAALVIGYSLIMVGLATTAFLAAMIAGAVAA